MGDTYDLVRRTAKYTALGVLAQWAMKHALALALPAKSARLAAWAIVVAAFARAFGPPDRMLPYNPDFLLELPFLGALLELALNRRKLHNVILERVSRINFKSCEARMPGTTLLLLMDPRDREYVLKTSWRNFLKNREGDMGNFELVLGEVLGRGIFATDGIEWQDSRKIASHMFSGNGLKNQMEAVFNAHAAHTVEAFERVAAEGATIDIQEVFQCVVFDAFCEIAFGLYPDAASAAFGGKKPQFLLSFDYAQQYSTERIAQAPLEWHAKKIFSAVTGLGPDAELTRHVKIIDDYVFDVVRKRKLEQTADKRDLLSLYINYARESGQAHMLEDAYLRDTIVNFMIAGRDTTSCTLTNMCRLLSENPATVARLRSEVFTAVSANDHISWDAANQLHLVHAVFNETIRLFPPVGDDFRIAVTDDLLPSGINVVAGTRMFISNVSVGRDPSLWAQPNAFVPERWMSYDDNAQPLKVRRPDEYVFPVFWSGPRLCLGKDMARFEATVFCAKLFSQLDVVSEPGQATKNFVMGPVIFYEGGWHAKLKKVDRE